MTPSKLIPSPSTRSADRPSPLVPPSPPRRLSRPWLTLALILTLSTSPSLAERLEWNTRNSSLSVDAQRVPLQQLLQDLAAKTGWQIYLDPALDRPVSTRFSNLAPPDALRRLLGDLNFSFTPGPSPDAVPHLYVYLSSPSEATLLAPTPGLTDDVLANEWIVRLAGSNISISTIAAAVGAEVVGKIDGQDAYRLRFKDAATADQAGATLRTSEGVASIEHNHLLRQPDGTQTHPLQPPRSPSVQAKAVSNDQRVVVALIDTAIATDSSALEGFLLPAIAVNASGAGSADSLTHGTAMAETLLQALALATPDPDGSPVRILPIDVYGSQPITTTFDVVNGLLAAAREGANVINLSLGGEGPSPLLQQTIQTLQQNGVLIIAAAGNQPTANEVFPAAFPEVLAVTAGDRQGNVAPYANYGDFIDLIGPGTTYLQFNQQTYVGSGTSYASAHLSGVAAAFLSHQDATPASVNLALREKFGFRTHTQSAPP